jgi:hypothetical protein
MLIIAFTWTTAAFNAGAKTCTRRDWDDRYASRFTAGMILQGWDRGPRNGGRTQGLIKLIVKPYKENTADMPEEDYENEGLGWMERQGLLIQGVSPRVFWESWKKAAEAVYVVRFKKLETPAGLFYII